MHPNPVFRIDDRAKLRAFVERIGFGKIFAMTPDGPRVAHTPLVWAGEERLQFHLSDRNALCNQIAGTAALAVVDGPHGYVSPRWYAVRDTVPTWDYATLELEGEVRTLADDELEAFLHRLIEREETRLGDDRWHAAEASEKLWESQFRAITGFELAITDWRATCKLSQKKSAKERGVIARGHEGAGNTALAAAMRDGPA